MPDGYRGRFLYLDEGERIYTGVDKPADKALILDLQAVSPSDYADEVV